MCACAGEYSNAVSTLRSKATPFAHAGRLDVDAPDALVRRSPLSGTARVVLPAAERRHEKAAERVWFGYSAIGRDGRPVDRAGRRRRAPNASTARLPVRVGELVGDCRESVIREFGSCTST